MSEASFCEAKAQKAACTLIHPQRKPRRQTRRYPPRRPHHRHLLPAARHQHHPRRRRLRHYRIARRGAERIALGLAAEEGRRGAGGRLKRLPESVSFNTVNMRKVNFCEAKA